MSVLDQFAKPLADALVKAKGIGLCQRTKEADTLWESVYPQLRQSQNDAYGKATERACPQVMRLAMLYALMDGADGISVEHLKAGLSLWAYCDASAKDIFSGGLNNKTTQEAKTLADRLLFMICKEPGITESDIHAKLGRHFKAEERENALAYLEAQGVAHAKSIATKGRTATGWFPGTNP